MKTLEEQAEKRYGTDPHSFAQQRDGFVVGAKEQLSYVIARLRSIRRYDLDIYRDGEFGIDKERRYEADGGYVDSEEIDDIINILEKQLSPNNG